MMSIFRNHWKWMLTVVVAIPAMTYAAAPEWTEETIEDAYEELRDYSENKQIIEDAAERRIVMQEDLELIKHRISRKEMVLDQIENGGLSLTAAGEHFLSLDRENETLFHMNYRPGSLAECSQYRVIRFLRIRHNDTTGQKTFQSMIQNLEQEFEARFGYPPPRE